MMFGLVLIYILPICISAERSPGELGSNNGDQGRVGDHLQQRVHEGQVVAGQGDQGGDRPQAQHLQHAPPDSPANLGSVKQEGSHNQQAFSWIDYDQGAYGNNPKPSAQNVGLASPVYQSLNSQGWSQAPDHLSNYLDINLAEYHNTFFQQPEAPEPPSDGLDQIIKMQQQQSNKKEQSQMQPGKISNQYAAQPLFQMQLGSEQQGPGFTSIQLSLPEEDEEEVKPLSKWKTKTYKSQTSCEVCSAKATGWHYNVQACEGCKAFFKRSVTIKKLYKTCTVRKC